jgi:ribose transport system permease protein
MNSVNIRRISKSPVLVTVIIIFIIAAIYAALNSLTGGKLLAGSNILFVLSASVVTSFVVIAFCFMITMGFMDLSLGAIMILASNVGGILAVNFHWGYFGLILGSVTVAICLGLLNIKLMLVSNIPSWVFGLGIAMIYEAIGAMYNSSQIRIGKQVVSLNTLCRELGSPPWNLVVLAAALFVAYLIYNKTSIGFGLRAVGSNKAVAKMMGINIEKTIILAALCAGFFAGFASAINESYGNRVGTTTGLQSIATIFTPLAAYLLAKALENIFNIIIGAVISAVIITSIFNVLTLLGVPSGTWQEVVMGGCVIVCGILSQRRFEGVVK